MTGVSAGAILATPAFIGDPGVLEIYRHISDDDIVNRKILPFSLFSDGLASTAPLRKIVGNMVGEQQLLAVARRAAQGARLLVGVVNLDDGAFVEINLGEIATAFANEHSPGKRTAIRRRYVDAIVASGTVPLAMEPVYLDCALMVDGGVRKQLFLPESADIFTTGKPERSRRGADDASTASGETPMVFVVINGPTQTNFLGYNESQAREYTNPNLADIAQRSIAAMLDSNLDSDVAQICSLTSEFRVSIIAADQVPGDEQERCASEDDGGFFPQPFMACLYDTGFRQGQIYRGSQSPDGLSCLSGKDLTQP